MEPAVGDCRAFGQLKVPGVDEWVTAELQFPNGVTGTAGCNMAPAKTDTDDAVRTMRLIDSCYQTIGMQPRSHR